MRRRKGFTLAEMLIVVAIIVVLTGIAIAVFTKRLEASRETVDIANVRSAFALLACSAMSGDISEFHGKRVRQDNGDYVAVVSPLQQGINGWTTNLADIGLGGVPSSEWVGEPAAHGSCVIRILASDGKTQIIWRSPYDTMPLQDLRKTDNTVRKKADQNELKTIGKAILDKKWTKQQLFDQLGIKIDSGKSVSNTSSIRIADYYQLKENGADAGFQITSRENGELEELLSQIGFYAGETSTGTRRIKDSYDTYYQGVRVKETVYDSRLFSSDALLALRTDGEANDTAMRTIILSDFKQQANGVITGFTIYTKAMDGQANMSSKEKKEYEIKVTVGS